MTVTWGSSPNNQITTDPDEGSVTVDGQFIGSFIRTADGTGRIDEIATKSRIGMAWSSLTAAQRAEIETVFAAKGKPDATTGIANTLTLPSPDSRSWAVIGAHNGLKTATEGVVTDGTFRYSATMTVDEQ